MIDYEKLKIAHEIAINNELYFFKILGGVENEIIMEICNTDLQSMGIKVKDCDELISKLTELTAPNPKYADGQEVWMDYDGPHLFKVKSSINAKYYLDDMQGHAYVGLVTESEIYATKQALIDAQMQYWGQLNCAEGNHLYEGCKSYCKFCAHIYRERCTHSSIKWMEDRHSGSKIAICNVCKTIIEERAA